MNNFKKTNFLPNHPFSRDQTLWLEDEITSLMTQFEALIYRCRKECTNEETVKAIDKLVHQSDVFLKKVRNYSYQIHNSF